MSNIDMDLISDIVLFRQNQLASSDIVYDVKVKGGHFADDSNEKYVVYFERTLIDISSMNDRRSSAVSDDMIIDMSEYTRLLREKKLKEIGI